MKVFYHKNCSDGVAAAAVANYWFNKTAKSLVQSPEDFDPHEIDQQTKFSTIEYIPINYVMTFPMDTINKDEEILITDFSIEPAEMLELLKITENVTWIDHHKSALIKYNNFTRHVKGVRSNSRSGAYLTWRYLTNDTPDAEVPRCIELVDDHDRWIHKLDGSEEFKVGAMLCGDMDPLNSEFWDPLFEGDEKALTKVIDVGEVITQYQEMWRRKAEGYTIVFEGLKFLVMNKPGNSRAFKYIDDGTYDGLMTWTYNGEEFVYVMYHGKKGEKDKLDLSKIAAKYGGGGHEGACGFNSTVFYACENPPEYEEK